MRDNLQHSGKQTTYPKTRKLNFTHLRSVPKYITALIVALLLIPGVAIVEGKFIEQHKECKAKKQWQSLIFCQVKNSKIIDLIESYGILTAAILFMLEHQHRKKQSHLQAWLMIDSAKDIETSYARRHALEELNNDYVSLKRIDIPEADLSEIILQGAELREANLKAVNFERAKLQGAKLQKAELQRAKLQGAELQGANLWLANLLEVNFKDANLEKAKLGSVNLQEANLYQANLREANLQGSNLQGANLREAILENTDVTGADLRGVRYLDKSQIKMAKNWKKAKYDEKFCPEETDLIREQAAVEDEKLKDLNKVFSDINKALNLLEHNNNDHSAEKISSKLLEIKDAVEKLINKDEHFDSSTKEELAEELANLKEGVEKRDKAKEIKQYDKVAGKWLESKRERFKSIGGNAALEKYSYLKVAEGELDSPAKVKQFYKDIDNCLELLSYYIGQSQRPQPIYDGAIDLNFPISVYKEAFIFIIKNAIPEIMNEESNKLSNQEYERLIGHLNEFVKWLEKLESLK